MILQPFVAADNDRRRGGWTRAILAALVLLGASARAEAAEPPASLPVIEANEVGEGEPSTLAISMIAPHSWPNGQVRRAMLQHAAVLATENNALCFSVSRVSLDRKASYVPFPSGHMTVEMGGSAREWRRYWRLYGNVLASPRVRLGVKKPPRIGAKVVRAEMVIHLCSDGAKPSGDVFDATRIIADDGATSHR